MRGSSTELSSEISILIKTWEILKLKCFIWASFYIPKFGVPPSRKVSGKVLPAKATICQVGPVRNGKVLSSLLL